jgi:hypothetical protein
MAKGKVNLPGMEGFDPHKTAAPNPNVPGAMPQPQLVQDRALEPTVLKAKTASTTREKVPAKEATAREFVAWLFRSGTRAFADAQVHGAANEARNND